MKKSCEQLKSYHLISVNCTNKTCKATWRAIQTVVSWNWNCWNLEQFYVSIFSPVALFSYVIFCQLSEQASLLQVKTKT